MSSDLPIEGLLDAIVKYDIWPEELLSEVFVTVVERVLTKTERFVLEMRVEGKSWEYIGKILKVKKNTLRKHKENIVTKLSNNMSTRVDNFAYYYKRKGNKRSYRL